MPADRIVNPVEIAALIRDYLGGVIDGATASYRAQRIAGSTDRILSGHQTRTIVAAYWALRRLAETGDGRPGHDDLKFLLDCIEGRRRFPHAT